MEHLTPIPKPYAGFTWPGSTVLAKKESAFAKKVLSDPKGFLYNPSGMLNAELKMSWLKGYIHTTLLY